ncbi:hypothetical protein I309_04677 [Cryptococcus deuterogattii LA55]|nr:hypothetical protein I309_04677 [Cryptococcus deuterogattii LA55]KIR35909.1 hypothetical protein I352_00847 [Cryptococcus deuterogattii MMRL2647]KIR95283.1 hypothetical protein I304_00028 [Cryptococcus deuterogattii CBS 10090]
MQDHQWVHPDGLSSAESSLSFTNGTPTHDASLFNYAPSHHHHRGSTSSGYHMINPSGLGRSSSGIYVGGMGRLTTVAPTAIPPPVAVEKPLVPVFGGDSGRGRPKSKNPKAKPQGLGTERKARKKVAKACLACQKSHLTCDEQRPCTRCVKKGMADKCVEGVRKKAKYLMEGDERLPSSMQSQASSVKSMSPQSIQQSLPTMATLPSQSTEPQMQDVWLANAIQRQNPPPNINIAPGMSMNQGDVWGTQSAEITPGTYSGTSGTAANNEYQMLDAMFSSLSPVFPGLNDPLDDASRQIANVTQAGSNLDLVNSSVPNWLDPQQPWINPSPSQSGNTFNPTPSGSSVQGTGISPSAYGGSEVSPHQQWGWGSIDAPGQIMLDGSGATGQQNQVDLGQVRGPGTVTALNEWRRNNKALTPQEVYRAVVRPYEYTQGYHVLMDYLTKNFETNDVLRVVRSLASFRPSLIALQMSMTEEDEVFLEKSFQRTLIELEKLISYCATPTAVWRRTGEVCYVNPEFCELVGKTDNELLSKKTYIYQLFDKSSVVSYWEGFSTHAFENTTQNFFQPISLALNAGGVNPCTCCFTIRRDVFDLPSVVIGQFLLIPAETQ